MDMTFRRPTLKAVCMFMALAFFAFSPALTTAQITENIKITGSDSDVEDKFGRSVAVEGDRIAIGAPGNDNQGLSANGSVYVYDYDGTTWHETKLLGEGTSESASLGVSVAMSGNRVIAGAAGDRYLGASTGAAYIFEFDGATWNQTRITPSDAQEQHFFGWSVGMLVRRHTLSA